MPVLDLPPPIEERVLCSIAAAEKYGLPAHLVLAVAEQEGGKPGLWVRNANGTYDVGPMQFNTAYLAGLARYGITAAAVAQPGCYAYDLATWRLSGHLLHDKGDLWTRAAHYHSRNPGQIRPLGGVAGSPQGGACWHRSRSGYLAPCSGSHAFRRLCPACDPGRETALTDTSPPSQTSGALSPGLL